MDWTNQITTNTLTKLKAKTFLLARYGNRAEDNNIFRGTVYLEYTSNVLNK